jgi:exodeoxyribonuclease VII large subunit
MKSAFSDLEESGQAPILSVTTLNRLARGLLEDCFPAVTVEGEISNLSVPASGHWYLTLKDESAQIRCAMFRNRNMGVRCRPANGMQVIVRGKLSLYEGRGDYQLILESMQDAGAGALQRAFEALKLKLADEGLFSAERKLALPKNCRHVGIITSPTGAVIRDILSVFRRRYPAMSVTIFPVPVQGAEAPSAIVRALATAQKRQGELGLDAVIIARGGGSLEDLQAFNDESVARAIAACTIPTVSAVGHETDFSIADFVADLRAPTPSAAAELLSPDQRELRQTLSSLQQKLSRLISMATDQRRQQLAWLRSRLQHPGRRLQEQAQALDRFDTRLRKAMQRFLESRRNRLQMIARNLDNISPLQTLQRGYSITRTEDGHVITGAQQVKSGDRLISILADGSVVSVVSESRTENSTGKPT